MSFIQLLYHVVIRTKASEPTLSLVHSDKLYRYISGIMNNKKCFLYQVNGMEDHIHILFCLHPTISLSDFMRDLKIETSKMLKHTSGFEDFKSWGKGYATLTYSLRGKNTLIKYILRQREHHQKHSFKDEYISFLHEIGLEFNEKDWNMKSQIETPTGVRRQ